MKKFWSVVAFFGTLFAPQVFAFEDDPELDHECTSWMVFHDLTRNNTNILHKNRDAKERDIAVFISPADSPRKWIAIGTDIPTNMAINASGLAGVMNSGEKCIDPPTDSSKKRTPAMLQVIMESCDTASQAVDKLKELHKAGDYWHAGGSGSIFFFLDRNEGYICEMTAKNMTVSSYKEGIAVRANIWQNPGMYKYSRSSVKSYLNSSARAYVAISGLNQLLDKNGKITVEGIFDLSRHCRMPEDSSEKRSVCGRTTNSSASLELDRQYPDVLSTGYFTLGNPRHTVYLPVPVCVEKVLPAMADFSWSKAVCARFDKLGFDAPVPEKWIAFEKEYMAKYSDAKAKARKLLDCGKRAEAVKLINDAAAEIWNDAAALLK